MNNNENNTNNNNNTKNNFQPSTFNFQLPKAKVHCAIYTRKSNEEGLELEYNSLDNQYDVCLNFIKSHESNGWVVVNKRYDDGGFSGGNLDRPALRELINDVGLGLIDKIIIYKLDRISRSNIDYYKLADILQQRNIDIEIATQQFDKKTSIGRFSFNMMLSFAQFEREMTSDRITEKIRKQQSLGMWTGGITPIGYDVIDKKLIVNEYEANIIKTIFNKYCETRSIDFVLDILNQNNFKTKLFISKSSDYKRGGTPFNRGSIYKILNNKIYIGRIENKKANKIFNGIHTAIISEEIFNKAQLILKENMNIKLYDVVDNFDGIVSAGSDVSIGSGNGSDNGCGSGSNIVAGTSFIAGYNINNASNNSSVLNNYNINSSYIFPTKKYLPKKNSKMPYLLKGIMKCECCDSILTPVFTTKKKSGITYRYYKSNRAIKHSSSCRVGNIPAEQIENIVLNQIYNALNSPIAVASIIDRVNGLSLNELSLSRVNLKENILNENNLNENNGNNENNKNNEFTSNQNNNQPLNLNITESEIIKYLQNIQVVWNELFPREQMDIIKTIIKEIKVSEYNIKIVFNNNGIIDLLVDAGLFDSSQSNILENNIQNNNLEKSSSQNNISQNKNSQNNNSKTNNNNKDNSSSIYEINIPVDFRYRAGRSFITTPIGKDVSIINVANRRVSNINSNDLAVIGAIIKAESWKSDIEKNKTNISCIAKQQNKSISYICKVLNLSFLAPDIKKSILGGYAPLGLTLLDLYECVELDWERQREKLNVEY